MNCHMYISDPKWINEDATRKQAFDKLKDGREACIVIHKHKDDRDCEQGVAHIRQHPQLQMLDETQCYMLTKESLNG